MKSEKKISYLTRRNEMLIDINESLKRENQALTTQLEINTAMLESKKQFLEDKESALEILQEKLSTSILDFKKARDSYIQATTTVKKMKAKYESEMKKLTKRLREHK